MDMFLKISLNNYAEMNKFMYNLALCIMEQRQDDVSISLSTFLVIFRKNFFKKSILRKKNFSIKKQSHFLGQIYDRKKYQRRNTNTADTSSGFGSVCCYISLRH